MKKILLSVFVVSLLNISSYAEEVVKKVELTTSGIKEFNNEDFKNNAYTLEITEDTRDLGKVSTSFNCETGAIDISGEMADMEKEFDNLIQKYYKDPEVLVKEMATQEATELSLDMLALIHYNISNDSDAMKGFEILNTEKMADCVSASISKSFTSELEAGVGMNVYDLFSGKVGVNFSELLTSYKCVREGLFNGTDAESKKKWEESKKYVRLLVYKLINQNLDINFRTKQSPKCKELYKKTKDIKNVKSPKEQKEKKMGDMEQNQMSDMEITLSSYGKITDLSGNKIIVEVSAKDVPIGTEEDSISDMDNTNSSDEKQTEIQNTTETDKNKITNNVKYGTIISTTPSYIVKPNTIDVFDLKDDEIKEFNLNIIKKVKSLITENPKFKTYNNEVKNATYDLVSKLLTITTIKKDKLEETQCYFAATSTDIDKYCSSEIFTRYVNIEPSEIKNKISEIYVKNILNKTYQYNKLGMGYIDNQFYSNIVIDNLKEQKTLESEKLKTIIEKDSSFYSKENIEKFRTIKHFIGAGEDLFKDKYFTKSKTGYDYDIITEIEDSFSKGTINYGNYLLEPLNEFQYLKLFYEMEDVVKIKLFLAQDTKNANYFINSLETMPFNNSNFKTLDRNKNYIISKGFEPVYGLTVKELEEMVNIIRKIKRIYAIEIMKIINGRLDSLKTWEYNFYKNSKIKNSSLRTFIKEELSKIELKLQQRRLMIKIILEKDIFKDN